MDWTAQTISKISFCFKWIFVVVEEKKYFIYFFVGFFVSSYLFAVILGFFKPVVLSLKEENWDNEKNLMKKKKGNLFKRGLRGFFRRWRTVMRDFNDHYLATKAVSTCFLLRFDFMRIILWYQKKIWVGNGQKLWRRLNCGGFFLRKCFSGLLRSVHFSSAVQHMRWKKNSLHGKSCLKSFFPNFINIYV